MFIEAGGGGGVSLDLRNYRKQVCSFSANWWNNHEDFFLYLFILRATDAYTKNLGFLFCFVVPNNAVWWERMFQRLNLTEKPRKQNV